MDPLLGKALLGAGLGGLGGAFGSDPGALHTFVGGTGETGIEGGGPISVDPGDLLAQGFGQLGTMRNAFADRLAQGTEMGPASIVQTPAYAYGGALPAPLGITVSDPGFLQRPGIELAGYSPVGPGGSGLGDPSGFPSGWNEDDSTPGGGGGGDNPPRDPRTTRQMLRPLSPLGGGASPEAAMLRFADAANILRLKQGRPLQAPGGFA
jgi:hypothetical protein